MPARLTIYLICLLIGSAAAAQAQTQDPAAKWNEIFEDDADSPFSDWDPLAEMHELQKQMDDLFGPGQWAQGGTGNIPGKHSSGSGLEVSQSESATQYIITITTAPDDDSQVDVTLKGYMISIASQTSSQKGSGGSTFKSMSAVSKAFMLPEDADPATIQTRREKNQVIVTIDKRGGTPQNPAGPQDINPAPKKVETL